MRRRIVSKDTPLDPNAPPPVPGSGASLPPRPAKLAAAAEALAKELGIGVASGYGFGDNAKDRTPAWRLFAFTDDKSLKVPTEFQGFPVSRRGVPKAGPAWGKAAHGHQHGPNRGGY